MTALWDYIKNQQQWWQQDDKNKERTALSNYIDKNQSPLWNYIKRQNKDVSSFWFDEKTISSEEAVNKIKEEADKMDRRKYWIVWDMRDSITWLFWWLWDLAEYWRTSITNENDDWWINDWKKYKEYSSKMNEAESEEKASDYMKKMIDEGIINEAKYNRYLNDQKNKPDYAFTQAKEEWKNVFNNRFESALSPIMQQATNRYQIDAISKGVKEIEDQYSMAYENAMNAYNDTRDDRILDEWLKISKEYEDSITKVTQEWAKKIVAGKTYWDAYGETINDAANKKLSNDIVSLERHMTNKLYQYTLNRNFNDAWEYATTWNLFQALNSTVLWAKNLITWWLQQIWFATEELKQDVTGRYDVTEELANLYVFDEKANWITKTLWWAQWVGNWLLDSLPQIAPVVWELFATRKVPWTLLKKLDKAIDATRWATWFNRVGTRRITRYITEKTMDNLVYDTSIQVAVWHPITWEEENINFLFNTVIDWAQALIHAPANYFKDWLKSTDIMNNNISRDALEIAKQLDDKNLWLLTQQLVLLRWMEITDWTKANKAWLSNSFDLDELRKIDPDLAAKYEKIQKNAVDYTNRIQNNIATLQDRVLTFEDLKGRKAAEVTDVLTQSREVAESILKRSNTIKWLSDFIFSWAKAISDTFRKALADGRITEAQLRLSVKSVTNISWVDDLILWLVKWDATMRENWLVKIAQSNKKLDREEINRIYNWTILDLLERNGKWDLLKEDEWIWTFQKNADWQYVDVYWVNRKDNWDDMFKTYSYDEVIDFIKKHFSERTIWANKFRTYDAIDDAYKEMETLLWIGTYKGERDATDMFRNMDLFPIDNWAQKTTAEKDLLKEILNSNWFKIKEENWEIVSIVLPASKLEKLHKSINTLTTYWLTKYWKDEVDAYKLLYFSDIYSSFKRYIRAAQAEWENIKELKNNFKTFFEQQFIEMEDWEMYLKASLRFDDEWNNAFKEMFLNKATFKEIENEAANNLIKDILKEATKLDINDEQLYNKIKKLVCWRNYKKEALPIVNSLFNQAKWMKKMWMWDDWIKEITRVFWELITDQWTVAALSTLNSDYLYKAIISKLVLENNIWTAIYKDSLIKLFQKISTNLTPENKKLIESLDTITKKIDTLTTKVPNADKEVLLNRLQEAFDKSQIKFNPKKNINSKAIKWSNWIYNIKDASELTDIDIDNLSTLISVTLFKKNNLPDSILLTRLKSAISKSLDNARANWGKLKFSIWQWLKEEKDAINLTLLWDIQLAQLLKNPYNMMQTIISKYYIQNDLQWVGLLWDKMKLWNKIKVWQEYKDIILWLKWLFTDWFEKNNDDLIKWVINELNNKWVLVLWNVRNRLVELNKWLNWKSLEERNKIVVQQIDNDISKLDHLINLMNVPWNPKQAEEVADELLKIQLLLERGKNLIMSNSKDDVFQIEMAKSFEELSKFARPQFKNFNWVVSQSKIVQDLWDKWTNLIYKDSPYNMKWKWLEGKKFVILDTETTWLPDDLPQWILPEIVQLSYRVIEVWKDWTVKVNKLKWKNTRNAVYNMPKDKKYSTQWARDNYEENIKPYYKWKIKDKFNKNDPLYKELERFAWEENTYFIWHNIINFDAKRLEEAGIKLNNERLIGSDYISTALIPVWLKNHKQETLVEAFEPIENAIKELKIKEWMWDAVHHNSEVDVMELQEVFWYLINHALKNEKTTEEELLNFLTDTSSKLSEETRWANAVPFYSMESRWDYQKKYDNIKANWQAEYTFDMPYLLTQMFGSNTNRSEVDTFLTEFQEKFWEKQATVNILDVIDSVSDKLWDERSLYIINRLKEYIDPEDVIDINKVLLWEEVKNWYNKLKQVRPDISFSEYCTNRLVANILATKGMYNENVIGSINSFIEPYLQTITADKLVVNWEWTLDTEAFLTLLNRFNDKWIINLWKRGSWKYSDAINRILESVRWLNMEEDVAKEWEEQNIKLHKNGTTYALQEFNKALYDYINNWDSKWFAFAAKDLFSQLFWKETKQWDDVVFDGWEFSEYMQWTPISQTVWRYNDNVELEARDITKKAINQRIERRIDIENEIDNIDVKLEELTKEIGTYERRIRENKDMMNNLNKRYDKWEISREEYLQEKEVIESKWKEIKSEKWALERERYNLSDRQNELDEELWDIKLIQRSTPSNAIDREIIWDVSKYEEGDTEEELKADIDYIAGNKVRWNEVDELDLWAVKWEGWNEWNNYEEYVAETENSMIEWQSAVDAIKKQPSTLESRITAEAETSLDDETFIDNLYWKKPLIYDNIFLVDETTNSTKDYIKTSYNGILDILSYGREKNKDNILIYLKKKYDDIAELTDKAEAAYKEAKEKKWFTDDMIEKKRKEWIKHNSLKSFLYNSITTLEGTRATLDPEHMATVYWFDKNLIWAKTNRWVIKEINIWIRAWWENTFNSKIFWSKEFDKNEFMNSYMDALWVKWRKGIIITYTVERPEWIKTVTEVIKPNTLFDSPFGKYLLNEYWIPKNALWAGEYNKTLPAISLIKKQIPRVQKDEKWDLFRTWWRDGKKYTWPWYNWNEKSFWSTMPVEDLWKEGIWYSDKKYVYAYKYLDDETKWRIDKLLENVEDKSVLNYLKDSWREELDLILKDWWYESAEDIIYNKIIKPAADKWKKEMKDWRKERSLSNMMTDIVKAKELKEAWSKEEVKTAYAKAIDKKYKTPTVYYKMDNYISKNDKTFWYEPMIEKILSFRVKVWDKEYHVIGYEPQFYRVHDTYDITPAELARLREEDPDKAEQLSKEIMEIVYPWEFVSNAEERNKLLRSMDVEANQYRDTFEYVHDMDEVKVLVEDESGNLYEWILNINRFQKNIDENWYTTTKAWTFQLSNLKERSWYKSEWEALNVEKTFGTMKSETKDTDRIIMEEEQKNVGKAQQRDWNTGWWKDAKTKDEAVEVAEHTDVQAKQTSKDINLMLDVNPLQDKNDKIWKTRILNFTNYDVVNESEELQQIVWLRTRFIWEHWEDLKQAVKEFNDIIKNYEPEQQKQIYDAIRAKAASMVEWYIGVWRKENPWDANMIVNALPDNLKNALNKIWKVFHDWWWNPQYQYLMLDFKNDWFEWILKNIWHNHKWAAVEYRRATWENLKEYLTTLARRYVWNNERQVNNLVSDILWDPLWTWTMNKMVMGLRSMWRFIKYWPVLFPLSWVMMLANSALLWITRYWSESAWFRWIMNNPLFDKLIKSKADWWLWFADALNRTNEIMFNSNSDLGWTWFDKALDLMISPLPEGKLKQAVTTAMKWWTHSLFDLCAQWSVKSMELAKALEKNLVWWWTVEDFVKWLEAGTIPEEMINKILADTEKWYSRFFTNSATTLFSRHRFSRLYIFNALQWYVINRTDEIFSSIKDAVNWIGRRNWSFTWNEFTNYLQHDNQELQWLMLNVLLSAKLGFYMDRLVNWWEFNGKEYSDYMIDTSDYLSSIPATFFYWILTAPLTWIEDYAEYVKMNNTDFNVWDWLTVAWLNTISEVMSKFFREGKVLNALTDSIVAFGKTGNVDLSYDVLVSELSNIANWLWRFQLTEWTHKYWLDYMNEQWDILWKILLNSDKTSESWRLQDKLYSLQTVDWILNWENWDWWKNRLLPYIPVLGNILQNSITWQWYTFTQAKWKKLQHIMDKDPTVQLLNNWDLTDKNYWKDIWWNDTYSDEAIGRLYKELTAFDYPNKQRLNWTEFKTWYEWELEQIKETVFTDEILRWLGWEEKDLMNYLNSAWDRKKAWLAKIMAAAEASRPWSSKIILSYLANQEEYNLLKLVTKKDYPSSNDVTSEEMAEIQRQVLEDYYPYMFLADKTSWYKAITEYVSWHFDIFDNLYKDDDMTWYLSTLWYMDMIMYQQARDWNVNAKYIKNSWTMLSKYFKSEKARMWAIDYTMHSIENSWMSRGRAASAKMWVLAANMDFYNKIQKNGMMNILYWDDIERYNWYVWWVLDDINKQWLNLSSENKKYSWKKYYKPYDYQNWLWENNVPMAKQFVPAAQKYLNWRTPTQSIKSYNNPKTYKPKEDLQFYWEYYEDLIKTYSDKLVKQRSKTYPAEYTEPVTYKRELNNRWSIRAKGLSFPRHKSKQYRTNVISNLPGSHW